MPQIPQVVRQTGLDGKALPYEHLNIDANTSGASIAHANNNITNGLNNIANVVSNINEIREQAKVTQFNNAIEQWKQSTLLDKENGYFVKQGQDASGKSEEIMKSYDDFVQQWKSENRLSKFSMDKVDAIGTNKRTGILNNVTNHDLQQTNNWAMTEGKLGVENAITSAVADRNNPDNIELQIANIKSISEWQGQQQNLDAKSIEALKKSNISTAYTSVLDAKLQEGDLSAGEFFEQHKNDIDPKYHSRYIGAIKNEEDKYKSRQLANDIISNSANEQEAIRQAEAIKDINMSDVVLSRVKRHYSQEEHFKNQAEKEALNNFYEKAVLAEKNGGTLSYDDIPDILDPDVKLSLMNYVNKNGLPETDNQIWEMLYDKSVNDAQGFAKEDLNKYRGFLSDGEYKQFHQKQEDIKAGKYYSNIKDDDKMIQAALKEMGLDHGNNPLWKDGGDTRTTAFNEIKALTREFEARKGRKITDDELQNITNSLGYKGSDGVQLYKHLEKGMNIRAGFIKDVMNDFVYYQNQHNGQMPPDSEKYKIIQKRVSQKAEEKRTKAQQMVSDFSKSENVMKNIAYTNPKPNEQKVLTYFADNQIPTLSKQLGLKLTVTSRWRNQAGSYHSVGRAADISMSEHSVQNRIKIYQKLLALPNVQAIGTSDPNILTHFAGNRKIVDERKYDRQHGTNHVHHAHVTLINANPATNKVVAKNNVYKF